VERKAKHGGEWIGMLAHRELQEGRWRLAEFLKPILEEVGRAERRHWGAF